MKKKWLGPRPTSCELCTLPLEKEFIDGATRFGPWAIMDPKCHKKHGRGLGLGFGQRYDLNTLEKLEG